ncbi:hypothetical protein NST86_30000 [Bacillus sp. FSL L8-0199]|uniref:Antimicrobial protein n=1 Tax=Bacillus thuringiensis TaxID=1428 RepID=A0AB36V2W3_BACTU|nr:MULTISPECIES: hypothetical protein [Bacillus cereus group]MCC2386004.1 hypothetical protein [Bacillus cereus]OUB30754.1 hypothetical protein BK739_08955 [Bacillus thuringiensis serovar pirenaica]PFS52624.1 hypothetical protein COK64_29700 [Bacillus thuringiensis]PGL59266.1 hypothetical protein CN939_26635 [Bacillus thuringiensis]PGY99652.1 hypothetical protein COE48_28800 [Bacillus thuringiensis]
MFKKLVVGTLAAGIALIGGIGAASAHSETYERCYKPLEDITYKNGIYYKQEFNTENVFRNAYTDNEGITWYFKKYEISRYCGGYFAYYEGRKY